ncbi:TPA: hypothetical protein N0F65_000181 [Lagenidium giganteum]|uniref:MI domain-containing protein n=1 Tax=Lagenidium giganteum TaxID=4803 RepID=A0AAV2YR91_9STRA|nr:TPA: hypothetical protein N0F65_000181 [Lagenidium giganteum]
MLSVVGVFVLGLWCVNARPQFVARIPNGNSVPGINALGHVNGQTGGGTLNVFGSDFRAANFQWSTALCHHDSDSDGATNGEELGDPCCEWTGSSPGSSLSTNLLSHPGIKNTFTTAQLAALRCVSPRAATPQPSHEQDNTTNLTQSAASSAAEDPTIETHSPRPDLDSVMTDEPETVLPSTRPPTTTPAKADDTPAPTSSARFLQRNFIVGMSIVVAGVMPVSWSIGMEQMTSSASSLADVFAQRLQQPQTSVSKDTQSNRIGGFLVCLDVPEGTEFGVDYEVFRTGAKFQGVKFVPLGLHFVIFRAQEHEHGIRQGFFVHVKQHAQVIVREWSKENEELGRPRPGLNVEHLEQAVRSFQLDNGLGPYPQRHLKTWQRLSRYISQPVLKRCGIELGMLLLPGDCDATTDSVLPSEPTAASDVVPFFYDAPRTACFTRLNKARADLSASETTMYHFDRSKMLEDLIRSDFSGEWEQLMGEFQLSFILFLQLSSMAALEQWKQFVSLLCSCDAIVRSKPELFLAFLKVLRVQLEQIPADFFDDSLTSNNFLRPCLSSLFEILDAHDINEQRFGLHGLTDAMEDDEYAPVVVLTDEMMMPDAADMHNPYKQPGGYQVSDSFGHCALPTSSGGADAWMHLQHGRYYANQMYGPPPGGVAPGPGMAPAPGQHIPGMGRGPPGSQHYHQHRGGRGQARGAPHYAPRGGNNMNMPRGGGQYYMPQMAPGYMMGQAQYMGGPPMYGPMQGMPMPAMPMGGMPMPGMPPQQQHQPPAKREKNVLKIVNPHTGERVDLLAQGKPGASTPTDSTAKPATDDTAKAAPASTDADGKKAPTASPKKKTAKSPAKKEPEEAHAKPTPATPSKQEPKKQEKPATPAPAAPSASATPTKSPQKTTAAAASSKAVESPKAPATKETNAKAVASPKAPAKKDAPTPPPAPKFKELPAAAGSGPRPWPSMEVVNEGPVRARNGRGGGGGGWEREKGLNRQSSRSGGGGSQWARSQEPPKRGRGDRGGRGGRGGRGQAQEPLFDGPVKPLERTDNRWIPVKAASTLEAAKKKVYSIMNKMTREKFDRLAGQLTDINMESLEMLEAVIKIIFDKALGEPHFCDMYADLCVHLEKNWKEWSFLKIVQNDDDDKFYWTTMAELDSEVVGPFSTAAAAIEDAETDDFEPSPAPSTMTVSEVRVRKGKFIKVWVDGDKYYWSGQLIEDLGSEQQLNGPFDSHDYASRVAIKACSFKRILLNACQEEFEKDNIYEELEDAYKQAKKENKITPEMEVDFEEKRLIMKGRMLGNIRFIGELYRKGMLQERIMHECILKLMGVKIEMRKNGMELVPSRPNDAPDEENVESMCKLLTTMGKDLDKHGTQGYMATYFNYLENTLSKDKRLCSRIIFMIKDLIELRRNKWVPRRKELQQKTLTEIRKEAEREQQRPPPSGPPGRSDSFRGDRRGDRGDRDLRRSNSSRDGGFSNRPTMAPVYSHSMNSRSSGGNKMNLPSRGIQRDDSVKTGPQGRPASFGTASRRGGAPASFSSRRTAPGSSASEASPAKTPKKVIEPLSDEAKEKIEKKGVSIAEEFASIKLLDEADACLAEVKKEFQNHMDVDRSFTKSILENAMEAKDALRGSMFDLIEQLSLTKKSLRFEGVRYGLQNMIQLGGDLWCDVPKMHLHVADIVSRFMIDSETTGVTIDWVMTGCNDEIEDEIFEELIDGDFLAATVGTCLGELKAKDLEKARKEVRKSNVTYFAILPSHARTTNDLKRWIDKYELADVLPFQPAFVIADKVANCGHEEVIAWVEKNLSDDLRKDSLFATHVSMFILNCMGEDEAPSFEQSMLLTGFLGDAEMQARFVSAIFQTRSEADKIKKLLKQLLQETAVTTQGLTKWLDLKKTNSVGRTKGLDELADFVEKCTRSK